MEGPKEKLDSTAVSQPAIYVSSMAAIEKLRATEGGQAAIDAIDVAAGLSLGEYTALAFAGAIKWVQMGWGSWRSQPSSGCRHNEMCCTFTGHFLYLTG